MTMSNSELLAYTGSQLGGLDKQRRFVLGRLNAPMPCPNCATPQSFIETSGFTLDTFDTDQHHSDGPYKCKGCARELLYTVPLIGDQHWRLVPVTPPQQ